MENEHHDLINHPRHYSDLPVECIDMIIASEGPEAAAHFCIANVWKYLYRHNNKNGREDIQKLIWYANKYLELTEEDEDD